MGQADGAHAGLEEAAESGAQPSASDAAWRAARITVSLRKKRK
jgi:hypothetical protein